MRYKVNVYILFLVLILGVSLVHAEEICCYHPDNGGISWGGQDTTKCTGEDVYVGSYNNGCDDYLAKKQCYEVDGKNYSTIYGAHLYDIQAVKDYIKTTYNYEIDDANMVPYSTACTDDYTPTLANVGTNTNQGSVGDQNTNDGQTVPTENDNTYLGNQTTEDILTCSQLGGPFGFFLDKNTCNNFTQEGTQPCLYNPYLTGYIKTFSSNILTPMENGCVAKRTINNCYDYKTEENCEKNPVKEFKNNIDGLKSCRWVNTTSFFTDISIDSGVCISNYVSDEKNLNLEYYPNRKNIIKNPSFEDNNSWEGNYERIKSQNSYNGNYYIKLNGSEQISQNISFITSTAYEPILYIRDNSAFKDSDELNLTIKEYNESHAFINETAFVVNLGTHSNLDGIFEKAGFIDRNVQYVPDLDTFSIEIIISSNVDVQLDAVSLETYPSDSTSTSKGFFDPLEIIFSKASNCNLCYDKLNLNLCTENKSDLLGDCSYMVQAYNYSYDSNLGGNYLGKDDNSYIGNWSYQSMPNSKVFCELYVDRDTCTDPNNYVNSKFGSFHPLVIHTLCKWDDVHGCYKDSDNSNGPDTRDSPNPLGRVKLLNATKGWSNAMFQSYKYKTNETGVSDFALGCDVMPPQSYVYLVATNSNSGPEWQTVKASGMTTDGKQWYVLDSEYEYVTDIASCYNADGSMKNCDWKKVSLSTYNDEATSDNTPKWGEIIGTGITNDNMWFVMDKQYQYVTNFSLCGTGGDSCNWAKVSLSTYNGVNGWDSVKSGGYAADTNQWYVLANNGKEWYTNISSCYNPNGTIKQCDWENFDLNTVSGNNSPTWTDPIKGTGIANGMWFVLDSTYEYATNISSCGVNGCNWVKIPLNTYNKPEGTIIIDNDGYHGKIGNVNINLQAYDIPLESCEDFDFHKTIYAIYTVNGETGYRYVTDDILNVNSMSLKQFLANSSYSSSTLLKEGQNDIQIVIKDQSGNIGRVLNYSLDMDLTGPVIKLLSPDLYPNGNNNLGKNSSSFIINVKDTGSSVKSCSFELYTPDNNTPSSYYDSSGDLGNSKYSSMITDSNNDKTYNFTLPIHNSSPTGNTYQLTVTCLDIFNQPTTKNWKFKVDFDTTFDIISPLDFSSENDKIGFLNNDTPLWAASSEMNLQSCLYKVGPTPNTLTSVLAPFEYDGNSYKTNITGTLKDLILGKNIITFTCKDNSGNSFSENHTYYFDNVTPELNSTIVYSSSEKKSVIELGGKYYVKGIDNNNIKLNLTLDGTHTWMSQDKEDYNLSLKVDSDYYPIKNAKFIIGKLNNESVPEPERYVSGVILDKINPKDIMQISAGDSASEKGLISRTYKVSFKDKANNSGSGEFTIYFDNSTPSLQFGGEIFRVDNKLYAKVTNPQVDISIGAPSYRTYMCNSTLLWQSNSYKINNKNSYKLSEFNPGIDLSKDSGVKLKVSCIDIFGEKLEYEFPLKYDNTSPILNEIYFKEGNNVYLPNLGSNGYYFSDTNEVYLDKLVFDMKDTKEDVYICDYTFSNSDHYVCDSNKKGTEEFTSTSYTSLDIPIFSRAQESYCVENGLREALDAAIPTNTTVIEKIIVNVQCHDAVNLYTDPQTYTIPLNINYVSGNKFVEFYVEYENRQAIFVARSLSQFDSVTFAYDKDGTSIIAEGVKGSAQKIDGLYEYRSAPVSLSQFEESMVVPVYAIGYGPSKELWDTIKTNLVVDLNPPVASINIPDMNQNGEVAAEEFEIRFDATDTGGSTLGDIELYLNDETEPIFSYSKAYDNMSIREPLEHKNFKSDGDNRYTGSVIFTKGVIGDTYTFKVLVKDKFGNSDEKSVTVKVIDGVAIRLKDSSDSFADVDGFSWITNVGKPTLVFQTTRVVERCEIYPFTDTIWQNITGNENIGLESQTIEGSEVANNTFSFDLSSFDGFDLEQVAGKKTDIKIRCRYNSTYYNFTRNLMIINSLPDYVLSSSEGFLLNEEPYKTDITITNVGFYKYVTCNLDGDSFNDKTDKIFTKEISFSDKDSGTYDFKLECKNKLGVKGPTKTYSFIVNKNAQTDVSDVKLTTSDNRAYNLVEDETNYINDATNLGLSFIANKKMVDCSYKIVGDSIVDAVIDFFVNLFSDNSQAMTQTSKPYLFKKDSGLNFNTDKMNRLTIMCDGMTDKSFDIQYLSGEEEEFDFGLS